MKNLPEFASKAWLNDIRKALAYPSFKVKPPTEPLPERWRCKINGTKGETLARTPTHEQYARIEQARLYIDAVSAEQQFAGIPALPPKDK